MEIIDAHAHIYPEKIAEKATVAIGDFYDIKMENPIGTSERLIENGSKIGVSRYLVHSCATKATQVHPINEFIKKEVENHKEFIGFMTLHEDLTEEEINSEIEWAVKNGFYGIKLHPDFQRFHIDGDNAEKFYRAVANLGRTFPILLHMGDNRFDYSEPARLVKMAKKYPNVAFIGAHFGGYRCWDKAKIYKGLENVYFDTSSSLAFISSEQAKSIIDLLGYEKFFFGDDFPMWDAKGELERFLSIPLDDDKREAILAKNIKSLLKL